MALCLTAGAISVVLAMQSFTLAWTHSIEKTRWEEDWRIEGSHLQLVAARIRGSGAGMEPPPEAVLREGVWHYQPVRPSIERLQLAHSPYVAGYEMCLADGCRLLSEYLPGIGPQATISLYACES